MLRVQVVYWTLVRGSIVVERVRSVVGKKKNEIENLIVGACRQWIFGHSVPTSYKNQGMVSVKYDF